MNYKERKILGLINELLKLKYIENPCDVKGLVLFHIQTKDKIDYVKSILDEIICIDIPKYRLNDIIYELKQKITGALNEN